MHIQFINHASVKIVTPQASITSDPWYAGSAFNNGWDLIRTDVDMTSVGSDATHIWLSHEHPDHFSIAFFKATTNRALRVLFQSTKDHRVVDYLRGQGFAVDEIPEGVDHPFAPGETIRVGRSGFYDSWCLVRADGKAILNLNDCELNAERILPEANGEIDGRVTAPAIGPLTLAALFATNGRSPAGAEASQRGNKKCVFTTIATPT